MTHPVPLSPQLPPPQLLLTTLHLLQAEAGVVVPLTSTDMRGKGHPTALTPTEAGVVGEAPTEEAEAGAGEVSLDQPAQPKDS